MPVIATEPKRLSDLVKHEYRPDLGFCRKVVTINGSQEGTLTWGTALGTADAGVTYVPAVDTAADGSEVIKAVFIGTVDGQAGVDATIAAGGTQVIALVRGPAIVGSDALVADASYTAAELEAELEALGILVGDQI